MAYLVEKGTTMLVPRSAHQPTTRSGLTLIEILVIVLVIAVLIALLLPIGASPRSTGGARPRSKCKNNLKHIGLALHNYHDRYGAFPPAYTVDAEGRRLHSWRTLILPFIDQEALYSQIDLSQPWDSPANAAFHNKTPETYHCPSSESPAQETCYVAIVNAESAWPESVSCRLDDIADGTGNTIMVIECVCLHAHWMEPLDLTLDMALTRMNGEAVPSPGSSHVGGTHVLVADGSCRFISENISLDTLRKLLVRNDGPPLEEW